MAIKTAAGAAGDDDKAAARAERERIRQHEVTQNALMARLDLIKQMAAGGDKSNIDAECGYPEGEISPALFKKYYKREGIPNRVVSILPEESWAIDPEVFEVEDAEETPWEAEWAALRDKHNLWHYCQRIDEISGIGEYGVILIGVGDGKKLDQPAAGLNERGERVERPDGVELMFLRTHDQTVVEIDTVCEDETNPRYGQPVTYKLVANQNTKIHWTRIVHIADNRKNDEVRGTPRQEPVFNRLVDLRKLLGGSAEMFWKGGFPGISFEVSPDVVAAGGEFGDKEKAELREQFEQYQEGLTRYLALLGVSAKSMDVQVADPRSHVETQLLIIAVTIGVPLRVLLGSEEAKLASSQDIRTWNKRLGRRQQRYLTPMLIRPLIDRFIALGILSEPSFVETDEEKLASGKKVKTQPGYDVFWPDLYSPSEDDKATTIGKIVDALSKYIAGNVAQLIPPLEFLTHIMGFDLEEVEAFLEAAEEWVAEHADELAEEEETDEKKPGSGGNDEKSNSRDKKGGE